MLKFVILLIVVAENFSNVVPSLLETKLEGRAVQHHLTTIRSYPYQISLQKKGSHFCGGCIISDHIVVTSAHCLRNATAESLKVRAGSSQWISGGILVGVKSFKIHERYSPVHLINDIGIIRLQHALIFSAVIMPVVIAKSEPNGDTLGDVSFWGTVKSSPDSPPLTQLKYAVMPIFNRTLCSASPNKNGYLVTKSMICTYPIGSDSCEIDAGAPLVSNNELVGVVARRFGCSLERYPTIYTNVAFMYDWILASKAALENEIYGQTETVKFICV